jgi:ribulose-phosphate 3-epimerase
MSAIVPAILTTSREDLEQKLLQLAGVVNDVQIDIIDGRFAGPATWPYTEFTRASGSQASSPEGRTSSFIPEIFPEGDMLPYADQLQYEMDLMVSDPEEVTGLWIEAGAVRMTIHVESTNYLPKAITDLQVRYGHAKDFAPGLLSLGLAINIGTELSILEPFLADADYVQFMGIATIGKQAQPFDKQVLRKIAQFKNKHPKMTIQVDGGVSLETAPALLSAGVDRLIVGSAIWKAKNILDEIEKFNQLVQEYGVYA